jgi:transcriptional regulator with XRE-family HTH domain
MSISYFKIKDIIIIFYFVNETWNLRLILSQNIRATREALHITQAKLAEYADISLPYMTDIEHCKTWVSDKTLGNIARALNVEAHELLIPPKKEDAVQSKEQILLRQIARLVKGKKQVLRQAAGDAMDDLILQIIRLYSE